MGQLAHVRERREAPLRRVWIRLDEDTFRSFKSMAARQGKTLEQAGGDAFRDAVVNSA